MASTTVATSQGTLSMSKQPRVLPKRFVKQQIPDSILNDPALKSAMSILPSNYNLELPKCIWRIKQSGAKRIALQFPEGLLMYALVICDILEAFADVEECFVLGDVTYGACCVDDFSASALGADFLIHYGHSCLVPIDVTGIPCLYVFVDIQIDVKDLVETIKNQFNPDNKLALAGTIQFSSAIHSAKSALEAESDLGHHWTLVIPQAKPLSAGEILGCTSPSLPKGKVDAVVFVADGRFHLEAFMIANPSVEAFRYDPYLKVLFSEKYDHESMREARKNAIVQAQGALVWGIIIGTLGRQGNPNILSRLQKLLEERGLVSMVVLLSEITPSKLVAFGDSVDAWIQIACPRLSIDWGESFTRPLLTPFEAEIALGNINPWWVKKPPMTGISSLGCERTTVESSACECRNGSNLDFDDANYPMDYYSQDGGLWNSSYAKRKTAITRPHQQVKNTAIN